MILFQKKDAKFIEWQRALLKIGVNAEAIKGSAIRSPLVLYKYISSKRNPQVFVFRYLNDYPSLFKSLLRFFSEFITICLCKIANIDIWWICHNIDKETLTHHRRLTSWRRFLVKTNSSQIFVTHKLLIKHAERLLNTSNVDSISLGYTEHKVYEYLSFDYTEIESLKHWLDERKSTQSKVIFIVGTEVDKVLHFRRINTVLMKINQSLPHFKWYAVAVGAKVNFQENIYNIPKKMILPSGFIKEYFDFYYRVIDDYSMSYTIFEAAQYQIPILTENFGFLPELVLYENIGYSIDIDNLKEFGVCIEGGNSMGFDQFLLGNNWEEAALTFKKHLK